MGFAQMGHVCNQCGWGYPKPHPSAKQRRAHKRVCGRLEDGQCGQHGQDGQDEVNKGVGVEEEVMERQVSGKSEEDVFSDACAEFADLKGGNAAIANIHQSDSPIQSSLSGALQVENAAETGHHSLNSTMDQAAGFGLDKQAELIKEANGSPSDVPKPKDGPIDETETFEDVESHPYIVKDVDTKGNHESTGIPSATENPSSETLSRESEGVVMLREIESNETHSDLTDASSTSAISDGIVGSKESEADSPGQKMQLSDNATNGYNVEEVKEILPVLSPPAHVPSEERPKETAKDNQSTGEAAQAQNEISEGTNMPSLAAPVPEDNHQEEALCSKRSDTEVFPKQSCDISEAKHANEGQELHSAETLVSHGDAIEKTEKDDTLHVETRKDFPDQDGHYTREGAITGNFVQRKTKPANEGQELHGAETLVSHGDAIEKIEKDDTLHVETRKDFPDQDGHYTREGAITGNFVQGKTEPELSSLKMKTTLETESHDSPPQDHGAVAASGNNIVSSEEVVVHEVIDAVGTKDDTNHAETRTEFLNLDEQYNRGGGAIDENSFHLSDLEESFQEMKSSPSNDINNSSAVLIDTSQFDNTTESAVLDSQDPRSENHLKNSKEDETNAQAGLLGVDDSVERSVEEVREVRSNEAATPQKDAEEPSGVGLEKASGVGSQRFMDNEDFLLDKQLKDMADGLHDGSMDSFQQSDSLEGYLGLLSDATVVSSSTSSPKEKSQEAESRKDECVNKMEKSKPSPTMTGVDSSRGSNQEVIQNQHQFHISSLRAAAINESPKTRAPLKAFLAEPNFDNRQDGTAQVHPKSPTLKDGVQSKTQKLYIDNEWNSPAKLPKHAHRKKSMFLPFLCCYSVN